MANNNLLEISRMDGIGDLPMTVRGPFARAWKLENEAGATTPECLDLLDKAVDAERKVVAEARELVS